MFNRAGAIANGGVDLDFQYLGANVNTANQNSYTFSGVSIGDPHPDRMVVVSLTINTTALASQGATMTIGGVTATRVGLASSAFGVAAIFYLKVPTGSTTDIVVTRAETSSTPSQCAIARYRFNTAATSALDSGAVAGSTASLTLSNIACSDGGVVFMSARAGNVTGSISWNGTDSATTDVNALSESRRRIFGHVLTTETSSIRDAQVSFSTSNTSSFAAVSFDGP